MLRCPSVDSKLICCTWCYCYFGREYISECGGEYISEYKSAVAAVGAPAFFTDALTDVFTDVFPDVVIGAFNGAFADVFTSVFTDVFTGKFTDVFTDIFTDAVRHA